MPKPTIEEKIADIDARLKKWRPRLTRATNVVTLLLRKRDRLMQHPKGTSDLLEFAVSGAKAQAAADHVIEEEAKKDEDQLAIPEELRVTVDVEKLRAARRKEEEAARHKMPLTGKAAMEHIKRRKTK